MQELKRLPVGEDNFRRVRQKNCYYVDKTRLIEKILKSGGSVNLFTRPRRFGKSLNMSMLKCFFEIDCDKSLFDGLYITENEGLCEMYMGKYPVISISLKGVEARSFEEAKALLVKIMNEGARRFQFLFQSEQLTDIDKKLFKELLKYYSQTDHYDTIKEWYDGYQFGNIEVYCLWDVICYCEDHIDSPENPAENYWLNTSGNEIIKRFIDAMGTRQQPTKTELEDLINGSCVQKEISQEMTYKELYDTPNHIWSALLMTGYLTQRGKAEGKRYNLAIPNLEIRNITTDHILKLFQETIEYDGTCNRKKCKVRLGE